MKKGRRGIFDFRLAIVDWKKHREATARDRDRSWTRSCKNEKELAEIPLRSIAAGELSGGMTESQ